MSTENFPRGGRNVQIPKPTKRKHEDNLFHIASTTKPKKAKKDSKAPILKNNDWQLSLKLQGTLTYNKMKEGMVILSCVRNITNFSIQVEFPGLTFGTIAINQISDDFNKRLSKELELGVEGSYELLLKNMIKVGQLLPAKILSINTTDKGNTVEATVNPRDINSNKIHHLFNKGETIWANVVSELDHGYELTVGVKNCRVFLPFKYTKDRKYDVGEPLYCFVYKVESSSSATTITVGTKQSNNRFDADLTLDDVIPGTQVQLEIEQISSHGIKGRFLDHCFGYIDETQMSPQTDVNKLTEGTTITAYVLFIETVTKVTYLTTRGLDNLQGPQFEIGKILRAKVISSAPGGLFLQLGKSAVGFITNKRLLHTLPKDAQLDLVQAVKTKYPAGCQHECRVLDYNYMQQLHICTFEKELIKAKVFNIKDVKIGDVVKVTVDKVLPNGLRVKSGLVHGFVPNIHTSNIEYNENIKTKFFPGMKLDARILNVLNGENVIFTLKQELIKCEDCVTSQQDIQLNSRYTGYVVFTKAQGALIAFFGDAKGWLSSKSLNADNEGRYTNPKDYFFQGQVVSVWAIENKDKKLFVSLNPPKPKVVKKIHVGDVRSGTITEVNDDGMKIITNQDQCEGFVPVGHLCSNLEISRVLLSLYQPKGQIKNLLCIDNSDVPIFSRREFIAVKGKPQKVLKLHELKRHMKIRCFFEEQTDSGIYVSTPIKYHEEKIFIPRNRLVYKNNPAPTFEKHQDILCRIMSVDYHTKKIELSVTFPSTLKKDTNYMVDTFAQFVEDVDFANKKLAKKNKKLFPWRVGICVECTLENIDKNGDQFVGLPNGAKGVIRGHLAQTNRKVGQTIEAIVLAYDFDGELVEMCSKKSFFQKINPVQDGVINKSFYSLCTARILLVTRFYTIGVLNEKPCNRQLVYLPSQFTEKDNSYPSKMKIVICRRVRNKIIGFPKKSGLCFDKQIKEVKNLAKKQQTGKKAVETSEDEGISEILETPDESSENEDISDDLEAPGEVAIGDENMSEDLETWDEVANSDDEMSDLETPDKAADNDEDIADVLETPEDVASNDEDTSDNLETPEVVANNDEEMSGNFETPEVVANNDEDMSDDLETADDGTKSDDKTQKALKTKDVNNKLLKTPVVVESVLSGAQSFYTSKDENMDVESSSDDEEEEKVHNKKKSKMSAQERAEAVKKEEQRISNIEKQLADIPTIPQTAEQFDRQLLANPNSSELWLQYMSMHVAAAELDKARAVGKKAVDTINMTLVKEKFNVWIALLNLENMYGTKESFEKVFEDAVRYNDSLEVYLSVINMFATAGKLPEMEEKIKKLRAKEKHSSKMWLELGRIYYSLQKFKEARNVKEAAIKSIVDKKRQFDIIVRFGILEFQLGDLEQAIANFETIINTFPSKVNIWIIYVDQLVKRKNIEAARKVLDRAVSQKFGVKTMKIFFQKYINFEKQHGTEENVTKVKELAKEYVTKL